MRLRRGKKKHPRLSATGMELAGAMSVASQMALLCPPGFDEWVRQEMTGPREPRRR